MENVQHIKIIIHDLNKVVYAFYWGPYRQRIHTDSTWVYIW